VTDVPAKAPFPAWALVGGLGTLAAVAVGAWFFLGRSTSVTPDPVTSATATPPLDTSSPKQTAKAPDVAPSVTPPPTPVVEASASPPAVASGAPSAAATPPKSVVLTRPAQKKPASAPTPTTKPTATSRAPSIGAAIESRR
jgi:hypothetical protein